MPRKRKIGVKENKNDRQLNDNRKEIMSLLQKVQTNEHYHKKYAKELRELYERMKHDEFMATFIHCLKQLMQNECNQFTNTGLKFMAEFVSSFQAEDMHPLFDSIFQWIFKTISPTVGIRLRLCEFVNQMLNTLPDDGDIEEFHCNEILSYMIDRLKDISPHVRVQAIKALCRLQIIDDPNDEVTQIFLFHLECDPSQLVRQAVISSIGRSVHTIPLILERLWDVDARVRRSVVAHMSNFSLNKCTVEQRLTLIEQGLADRSEIVRNIALDIMLPQWLALYDNNFVTFLSSLKSIRNESEMNRFRSAARTALLAMFRSHEPSNLIDVLPLIGTGSDEEGDNKYHRCIQLDKLTPELSLFWVAFIEFCQSNDNKSEHLEQIMPDLTTMCNYIATFSRQKNQIHDKVSSHCILLTLIEVLQKLDLSEATGRESVKNIVVYLLLQSDDDFITEALIKLCEQLVPSSKVRLQFYVDIVKKIVHPFDVEKNILPYKMDTNTETQAALLTAKLMELQGQQAGWLEMKECEKVNAIEEEIGLLKKHLLFLIIPYLPDESAIPNLKRITSKNLLRSLRFIFYGVCSDTVKRLIPSMYQLYEDMIRDQCHCDNLEVRNWALKCTATFSLLYGKLASQTYHVFCKQFHCHQVKSIWMTCIRALFQLIDRYGFDFPNHKHNSDTQPADTQPANTSLLNVTPVLCQPLDDNHNIRCSNDEYASTKDLLLLFNRYLDTSHDTDITCELIDGFCALIVHGRFFDEEIMSKLIVMFFNDTIEPKIIQILSVFFETLVRLKKQKYFQLSLYETLDAIAADKTLTENKLRSVLKFFVQSTVMDEAKRIDLNEMATNQNDLAVTFLTWMDRHTTDYKLLNVISKEILSLKLSSEDEEFTLNSNEWIDRLLQQKLHKETEKNLKLFKQMLAHPANVAEALQFSSVRPANGVVEVDRVSHTDEAIDDIEVEVEVNGNYSEEIVSTDIELVSENEERDEGRCRRLRSCDKNKK